MKKLLALLLAALLMATACTALAEPSSAYYVSVMDPIVYVNGEPMLDTTGLNIDLGALVSDVGCFAVQGMVNVGENYETSALAAQAQLDANGLTFTLDGMENVYSVDLTQYTNGFDVTTILPQIPAYTLLNTPIEMESLSIDLSLPVRYAAVTGTLAEFTAEDGAIAIDKTQGELIINRVLTALETAGESMNIDGIAELRAQQPAFDLTGTLTVEGDPAANAGSYAITGTGCIYYKDNTAGVPFELTYSDSAEELNMSLSMTEDSESLAFVVGSTFSTAADGRNGVNGSAAMIMNDVEQMVVTWTAAPVEDSNQMDYVLGMQLLEEQSDLTILLSTGTNGDDIGFALDVFVNNADDSNGMYLYYNGEKIVDEYGSMLNGYVSMGVESNEESYALDTYLLLQAIATDTTEWAYDSTGAIAIENMSETEAAALQTGVMGAVATAASAIMENVPGLAPIISSMMG